MLEGLTAVTDRMPLAGGRWLGDDLLVGRAADLAGPGGEPLGELLSGGEPRGELLSDGKLAKAGLAGERLP